jgi:hypothetical protein
MRLKKRGRSVVNSANQKNAVRFAVNTQRGMLVNDEHAKQEFWVSVFKRLMLDVLGPRNGQVHPLTGFGGSQHG